jgi:murein DD-endopeptidase MepM/ murein hydrolase activator NlpD
LHQINDAFAVDISVCVNLTNLMRDLAGILSSYTSDFHGVVPFDPAHDKLISMDFTETNQLLTGEVINDIVLFSEYIDTALADAGARYGIGGYGEHRTVYSRSRVFDAKEGDEPRRLHLGLDIWGNAGTPVYAPLDAIVHSYAFNDHYGDYGATIILEHSLNGHQFFSLYGHLSTADLNVQEGQRINKGKPFAHFGEPAENGHWPPHLHFQIIDNIGNAKGDYPGVCRFSERYQYLANCPDPDLVANLVRFVVST